jgi:hypothetical protein
MALQLSISKFGVTFPQAYARIIGQYSDNQSITAKIEIHPSKAEREIGAEALESFELSYPLTNKAISLFPWLYEQIQTDGYFKDAVDA